MKQIELELPVKDKTKKFILQLDENGWKRRKKGRREVGIVEAMARLTGNGSSASGNPTARNFTSKPYQSFDGK